MERIYDRNMTTTSGGNVYVLDENNDVWMTPARIDKGNLQRQDIVWMRSDGRQEGLHPPSSENPFHLGLYQARPNTRATIHAHPRSLVSFSICSQVLDTRLFLESWNVSEKVAFARYPVSGSQELRGTIAREFASKERTYCVVLESHGVVVGGTDLADAFKKSEALKFTPQTGIYAKQLNNAHSSSDQQIEFFFKIQNALLKRPARRPTSRGKKLRKAICDFSHLAYIYGFMVHVRAFCVIDFPLNTRKIPESYLFLKDVGTVLFKSFFGDCAEIARIVTPSNPAALLLNNGALIAERMVLDAFDRLEVLEAFLGV